MVNALSGAVIKEYNWTPLFDIREVFVLNGLEKKVVLVRFDKIELIHFDEQGDILDEIQMPFVGGSNKGLVASPNNEYFFVISQGRLFNESLEELNGLEPGSNFKDIVFSEDGKSIYVAAGAFPRIIKKYSFPELIEEESIPVPFFLFRIFLDGDQLVLVGNEDNEFTIVEVVDL